ncbi:MAG: methyltransferase domain-containing protein [Clostridia bacterium]|nr:methyltransferase domain-containing protein [Clostridia bacterium]
MDYILRSARFLASDIRKSTIRPGDSVIDATLGNGHDTLELCQLVGPDGHVYGFDVQPSAVESTRARLMQAQMEGRFELYCEGHEHMGEHGFPPVSYICFNLGWLPGGDKGITTFWETTRKALEEALTLLKPMGVCTVCAYPGHEEGDRERRELIAFLSSLPPQRFNVLRQHFLNAGPGAPECFVIQKQSGTL